MKHFFIISTILAFFDTVNAQESNIQNCIIFFSNHLSVNTNAIRNDDKELSMSLTYFDNSKNSFAKTKAADNQVNTIIFLPDSTIFDLIPLKLVFPEKEVNEPRFAKKIVSGEVDLYILTLRTTDIPTNYELEGNTIYIAKKDNHYIPLTKFEIRKGQSTITDAKYIGVLNYLFQDDVNSISKIKSTDYSKKDLVDIVLFYNNAKKPNSSKVTSTSDDNTAHFFGVGYEYRSGTLVDFYENEDFKQHGPSFFYKIKHLGRSRKTGLMFGARVFNKAPIDNWQLSPFILGEYNQKIIAQLYLSGTIGAVLHKYFRTTPIIGLGLGYKNFILSFQSEVVHPRIYNKGFSARFFIPLNHKN